MRMFVLVGNAVFSASYADTKVSNKSRYPSDDLYVVYIIPYSMFREDLSLNVLQIFAFFLIFSIFYFFDVTKFSTARERLEQ